MKQYEMKGPFFQQNCINYDVLQRSNFDDVDIAIDAMKLNYDVDIKEKIEVYDSYWITAIVNKKYNVHIRHHDLIGLTIYARDEQSNPIVTEIANYLSNKVFNGRKDSK